MISTRGYKRLTIDDLNYDGCLNLLEAFVHSLSEEYSNALYMFRKYKTDDHREALENVREVFLSKYFADLTGLRGDDILSRLEQQYMNKKVVSC